MSEMEIRNIAIIAHVDHGKTTLTDALMKQTGMVGEGFTMDINALERERGITIYSKNASIYYKGTKINIVDTPGHADFGSEVERVLRSIDSVVLLVDAQEGPMPQTRFVLKKSLSLGLKPIVVINKIDKPAANPDWTHEKILELFLELNASDEQINFPVVYAIGRLGIAKKNLSDDSKDLTPLLDTILAHVPPVDSRSDLPLRMQPFNLAYDNYLGRMAIGRVYEGTIYQGQNIFARNADGKISRGKVTKIFTFEGMQRKEAEEAFAGDIVMIAGLSDIYIGDTISTEENTPLLPSIAIDEPTICLDFLVNDSPFAGREGKYVTSRQLKERLERELEVNVGLRVEFKESDRFTVYGRGELHIAILLENMRREGYELQVSEPQVVIKKVDGKDYEPFEEVVVDIKNEYMGSVIEKLQKRRAKLVDIKDEGGHSRLVFEIPTRGLLGYRGEFVVDTRGEGILSSHFGGFRPWAGEIERHSFGSQVSMISGKALAYSLWNLQDRGTIYIPPGTEVYEGMIIGAVTKGEDLDVNPTKNKQLTNVRNAGNDEAILLTPHTAITIERGLEIMKSDEYLEITPQSVRLRKKYLTKTERARAERGL
jgi:GTP-binding protein